ncbi:uncharacterized protein LOC141915114 [Tubulanus polymorphus]|uniref:uncharacterized protein LOC141915114 n=1 Tax=Tubulanus polymorphus TaxID=672921 RepID=UPI003DA6051E
MVLSKHRILTQSLNMAERSVTFRLDPQLKRRDSSSSLSSSDSELRELTATEQTDAKKLNHRREMLTRPPTPHMTKWHRIDRRCSLDLPIRPRAQSDKESSSSPPERPNIERRKSVGCPVINGFHLKGRSLSDVGRQLSDSSASGRRAGLFATGEKPTSNSPKVCLKNGASKTPNGNPYRTLITQLPEKAPRRVSFSDYLVTVIGDGSADDTDSAVSSSGFKQTARVTLENKSTSVNVT